MLTGVRWIFFAIGLGSLVLFVLDPDIHAHPQLVLLAGTGLLGALTLWGLAGLLGPSTGFD